MTEALTKKQEPDEKATHSALVTRAGEWAHDHRAFFTGDSGSLLFRNALRTMFAIVPYVFVNVAMQHLFHRTVKQGKSLLGSKTLAKLFKPDIVHQAATIATSFTAFRSVSKIWNLNYDRIFGAKSAAEAADAISNLPGNIAHDAATILPSELASTATTAIVLSSIRTGIKNYEEPGVRHPVGKNFTNDWLANSLGYAAFFEANDRLYSVFNKKHFNGQYKDGTLPEEGTNTFTKDTPARLAFRNVGSVFMAALPFIAMQRHANFKTGNYNPAKNSYMKDVGIGLKAWVLPFAALTGGMELWQKNYDKLFNQLNKKSTGEEQQRGIV
jgi:hypothetical protein